MRKNDLPTFTNKELENLRYERNTRMKNFLYEDNQQEVAQASTRRSPDSVNFLREDIQERRHSTSSDASRRVSLAQGETRSLEEQKERKAESYRQSVEPSSSRSEGIASSSEAYERPSLDELKVAHSQGELVPGKKIWKATRETGGLTNEEIKAVAMAHPDYDPNKGITPQYCHKSLQGLSSATVRNHKERQKESYQGYYNYPTQNFELTRDNSK